MKELEAATPIQNNIQIFETLADFQRMLNRPPDPAKLKYNKHNKNKPYLPIGVIEHQLDEVYSGLWKVENFTTKVIANEIVGEIELHVFHPIFQQWIVRIGASGTMIQMKSERNGGDGDITNIRNKITNTLGKDYPSLKSSCVSNAAKSLGRYFGRDLTREQLSDTGGDTFADILETIDNENKSIEQIVMDLQEIEDKKELLEYWEQIPTELTATNKKIRKEFRLRLNIIQQNQPDDKNKTEPVPR